jgi:hypothetical protein
MQHTNSKRVPGSANAKYGLFDRRKFSAGHTASRLGAFKSIGQKRRTRRKFWIGASKLVSACHTVQRQGSARVSDHDSNNYDKRNFRKRTIVTGSVVSGLDDVHSDSVKSVGRTRRFFLGRAACWSSNRSTGTLAVLFRKYVPVG